MSTVVANRTWFSFIKNSNLAGLSAIMCSARQYYWEFVANFCCQIA